MAFSKSFYVATGIIFILKGDFDGTSAFELLNAIKENDTGAEKYSFTPMDLRPSTLLGDKGGGPQNLDNMLKL